MIGFNRNAYNIPPNEARLQLNHRYNGQERIRERPRDIDTAYNIRDTVIYGLRDGDQYYDTDRGQYARDRHDHRLNNMPYHPSGESVMYRSRDGFYEDGAQDRACYHPRDQNHTERYKY